jgi:hypothetical protein
LSRKTTSRVWARSAAGSEARNCSPSPRPSTSGVPWRTATISSSALVDATRAQAYIPSSSPTARRTAAARSPSKYDDTRLAITSVSVSVAKLQPSASSRRLIERKFSTMPLWMIAIRPRASTTGWALRSVGRPWVAQRVWATP